MFSLTIDNSRPFKNSYNLIHVIKHYLRFKYKQDGAETEYLGDPDGLVRFEGRACRIDRSWTCAPPPLDSGTSFHILLNLPATCSPIHSDNSLH